MRRTRVFTAIVVLVTAVNSSAWAAAEDLAASRQELEAKYALTTPTGLGQTADQAVR